MTTVCTSLQKKQQQTENVEGGRRSLHVCVCVLYLSFAISPLSLSLSLQFILTHRFSHVNAFERGHTLGSSPLLQKYREQRKKNPYETFRSIAFFGIGEREGFLLPLAKKSA